MGNIGDGAQNVSAFRNTISRGGIPSKDSFTYSGLFNGYYYPISNDLKKKNTTELLEPRFSVAQCTNQFNKDVIEKFLSVELHSKMDGGNTRDDLNLIIVLDVSGSMGCRFDGSYGSYGGGEGSGDVKNMKTKMEIANECVVELIKDMKDSEHLGIVLFDDRIQIHQSFRSVKDIKKDKLIEKTLEIKERGSTDMEVGFKTAVDMLNDAFEKNGKLRGKNNRVLFLTDAMPNSGAGPNELLGMIKSASKSKIFTTLVGVGLDFDSEIAEQLCKSQGANYFSVKNRKEFMSILKDEFNYIVSPVCFNTFLNIESEGYEVDEVYGTNYSSESSGVSIKVGSVSGSPKDEKGLKGCVFLVKLKEKEGKKDEKSGNVIKVTLKYDTVKEGKAKEFSKVLNFDEEIEKIVKQMKVYENEGIRKVCLLQKYVAFIHNFIDKVKSHIETFEASKKDEWEKKKIEIGEEKFKEIGKEEYEKFESEFSGFEKVSPEMKESIKQFKKFFENEMEVLKDKTLIQEVDVLDQFLYMK